jgi:long-chain acyl-CoA synthetase
VNQPRLGTRAGTVGHAVWGVEVEIAHPEPGRRIELLPPGSLGEVVVRGHNVFSGYLGMSEQTAEVLVDGWLRTGDLGTKDADGFITIVDRVKDMIIRGGFNVYPTEVEEVLIQHPDIGQVAVIGLPDPRQGEEVCAVVVPGAAGGASGAEGALDEGEIISWAKERLGKHKYPRRVEFVDSLPLGPSHKVLKRELRKRFATQGASAG